MLYIYSNFDFNWLLTFPILYKSEMDFVMRKHDSLFDFTSQAITSIK